jgi:excisionase family DNA binding protein
MSQDQANNLTAPPPPEAAMDRQLWTTNEVAEFLHVSNKTIFNLRKMGLPFIQLGGAVRFVPQEVRDYLANSRRLASHRSRQIIRRK